MKASRKAELICLTKLFGLAVIATLFFGTINNYKIVSKSKYLSIENCIKVKEKLIQNKKIALDEKIIINEKIIKK